MKKTALLIALLITLIAQTISYEEKLFLLQLHIGGDHGELEKADAFTQMAEEALEFYKEQNAIEVGGLNARLEYYEDAMRGSLDQPMMDWQIKRSMQLAYQVGTWAREVGCTHTGEGSEKWCKANIAVPESEKGGFDKTLARMYTELNRLRQEIDELEYDKSKRHAGYAFWSLMILADIEEVNNYHQFNNLGHDSEIDWLDVEEFLQQLRDEK